MINRVVILGGHIQALGLARQAKHEGCDVIVISNDSCSISRFSNATDKFFCVQSCELLNVVLKFANSHTLLLPTSDDYIEFMVENIDVLSSKFIIQMPSKDTIYLFSNKRNTYKFAERENIPHPKSFYPDTINDVKDIALQMEYPVVLKPAIMYTFHNKFGRKAYLCNTKEQLIEKCMFIEDHGFPINLLLVQEFLSGGAPTLYSYGAYVINGSPIWWIQANRKRQNPMDFGNSTTYAVTCDIPEIESAAKAIFAKTNYTGMAEVEFMYDRRSDEYKFLEVNTRTWKWHALSNALGFGFLSELIKYNNQNNYTPCCGLKSDVAWVERLTDLAVCTKEIFKGRMRLSDVFNSYKLVKEYAVWKWCDPLPCIMYVLLSPILYFKRY